MDPRDIVARDEKVIALYNSGEGLNATARRIGIDYRTVREILLRNGVPIRDGSPGPHLRSAKTSLPHSEIVEFVAREHLGKGRSQFECANILGVHLSTIKTATKEAKFNIDSGIAAVTTARRGDPFPKFIPYDKLPVEALLMLEDTPEGFERFFNRFGPSSDPKMKGHLNVLQPHSRSFVESAYHRCNSHPRLEGEVWSEEVKESSASSAACELCRWEEAVVINIAPDMGKTTVMTIWLNGVWETVKDRDAQGIIISETDTVAKQIAEAVATILSSNEDLIRTYGMFQYDDPITRWNPASGFIRVGGSKLLVGYNLLSRGMGSQITTLRAKWIVVDDAIDPKSVSSPLYREQTSRYFHDYIESRLGPGCRCMVVGALRHPQELSIELTSMVDEDEPETRLWKHVIFPGILNYATDHEESLWPERWSLKQLHYRRKRLNSASAFQLVYQQNPLADDDVLARASWIFGDDSDNDPNRGCLDRMRSYGYPEHPERGWLRVASFDPSPTKWAGFIIADVNITDRTLFECRVIFIDRWKGNIREAHDHFASYLPTFGVNNLIIEENLGHEYLKSAELKDLYKRLSVRDRKHHTPPYSKLDKQGTGAWALAGDFEYGRIRLPYGDPESRAMTQLLVNEATTFPSGATSDILMALSFIKAQMPSLRPMQYESTVRQTWAQRQLTPALRAKRWVRDEEMVGA